MLKIGEFARLAKVSIKQLRHYDELGLLPARAVDRSTGYRYYDVAQLATLNRLLIYRSLGFSLKETRRLLGVDTPPNELREMLTARRTALAARVAIERARLAEVEARIAQVERDGGAPRYEVAIRSIEPSLAMSLRRRCDSYDDVGELLRTIRAHLPRRVPVARYGAIWHRCSTRGPQIDCEALVFLDRNTRPAGTDLVEIPGCTVASVFHEDGASDTRLAYRAAIERATALGYRVAGPMRELYAGQPAGGMVEVQFPLCSA
ncbi:MAG TPA: MerR family transcriptional regulator [Steroidobacteraceae bacterium]|nr:MerR family transcriptional regulator [Steroidobacteraceae bacterium]